LFIWHRIPTLFPTSRLKFTSWPDIPCFISVNWPYSTIYPARSL